MAVASILPRMTVISAGPTRRRRAWSICHAGLDGVQTLATRLLRALTMRPYGALIAALGVATVLVASAQGSATGLPAPVTLEGVGGVIPGMSIAEVRKRWGLRFPVIMLSESSSEIGLAPICAGRMRGQAHFFGLGPNKRLTSVEFASGATTDRGVGVGSTPAELRRAYGTMLRRDSGYGWIVDGPRASIGFALDFGGKRIAVVEFGRKGRVGGYNELLAVDC